MKLIFDLATVCFNESRNENSNSGLLNTNINQYSPLESLSSQKSNIANNSTFNRHLLWILFFIGIWCIVFPYTFSLELDIAVPSGDRKLWLSDEQRILFMKWSEILTGILISLTSLTVIINSKFKNLLWLCCFFGIWLTIEPLLFWAPTPASYLNDTLIGALIIGLTTLTGILPGLEKNDNTFQVPSGWTYNPSCFTQRVPLMIGGFLGWVISRYLSAYQLGYIPMAIDPFFGDSTIKVLNSSVSLSLPISDGGVGAIAYTFEFFVGMIGGESRWKTKPWIVFVMGLIIIPVGFAHVFLVVSQPVVVGYWCTFCLMAASTMLMMITFGIDEIFATLQLVVEKGKEGEKLKSIFLYGDRSINKQECNTSNLYSYSTRGIHLSIPAVLSVLMAITIICIQFYLHPNFNYTISNLITLVSLVIIVFSVLSMNEMMYHLRFVNIALSIPVKVMLWFATMDLKYKLILTFLLLIITGLSMIKRKRKERFGMWEKYL